MRLTIVRFKEGKRQVVWPTLLLFVMASYATVIGAAELFWKLFSGGYSPLLALFATFIATLIVIREVAQAFYLPVFVHLEWMKRDRV